MLRVHSDSGRAAAVVKDLTFIFNEYAVATTDVNEAHVVLTTTQATADLQRKAGKIVIYLNKDNEERVLAPDAVLSGEFELGNDANDVEVCDAVRAALVQTYYARVLSDAMAKIPAAAAKHHWDSVHSLKQQLGLPDTKRVVSTSGRARILGVASSSWNDNHSRLLLVVWPPNTVGNIPEDGAEQAFDAVIIAAPYGRKDVDIGKKVREHQSAHVEMPVALTFYEGGGSPSETQIEELIRDGIDQTNHGAHLNNITPLSTTASLRDALEQLQLTPDTLAQKLQLLTTA